VKLKFVMKLLERHGFVVTRPGTRWTGALLERGDFQALIVSDYEWSGGNICVNTFGPDNWCRGFLTLVDLAEGFIGRDAMTEAGIYVCRHYHRHRFRFVDYELHAPRSIYRVLNDAWVSMIDQVIDGQMPGSIFDDWVKEVFAPGVGLTETQLFTDPVLGRVGRDVLETLGARPAFPILNDGTPYDPDTWEGD